MHETEELYYLQIPNRLGRATGGLWEVWGHQKAQPAGGKQGWPPVELGFY